MRSDKDTNSCLKGIVNVSWRKFSVGSGEGKFPTDAIVVGHSADRAPLCAARGTVDGGMHIGKIQKPGDRACEVSYGGKVVKLTDIEILCGSSASAAAGNYRFEECHGGKLPVGAVSDTRTHTYTHAQTHMHIRTHIWTRTYMHTYTHTHTRTHTYALTHTYTHTYTHMDKCWPLTSQYVTHDNGVRCKGGGRLVAPPSTSPGQKQTPNSFLAKRVGVRGRGGGCWMEDESPIDGVARE